MAKAKDVSPDQEAAKKRISKAAEQWKAAKADERAARDRLAELVRSAVADETLTENKIAKITDIPRMTIRKMLGKD